MPKDKLNKTIENNQYAMLLSTHWKSNDVNIVFIQIDNREPTHNRVYYKRLWTLENPTPPNNYLNIQQEITWTSPSKIFIINEGAFIDGHINTTFKHIQNITEEEIANQLMNAVRENMI